MNTYRQYEDERRRQIQQNRQPSAQAPQQPSQQQAPPQQQMQPQGQAIPLNRAGGESYDQGQQMTMEDAIRIASQYGAVPSRISSGTADPNNGYMGVWAIPTAQGWVPLSGGGGTAAPQAPPTGSGYQASDPTSTSDRARGAYGPGSTPMSSPTFGQGAGSSTPRSPSMPGAAGMAGQGVPGYNSPNAQSSGSIGTPNVNVVVNNTPSSTSDVARGPYDVPRQPSTPMGMTRYAPPAQPPMGMTQYQNPPGYPGSSQTPLNPQSGFGPLSAAAAMGQQRRMDIPPVQLPVRPEPIPYGLPSFGGGSPRLFNDIPGAGGYRR